MGTRLIHDGYTRDGFIDAVENDPDSLRFQYRPMLPEDVDALLSESRVMPARQATKLLAAAVAERLVSWDAIAPDDTTATIDVEHVRSLPWRIFQRLYNVVAGLQASDPLPKAAKPQTDEMVQRLLHAAGDGKPAGLAATVADRKN